MRPCPHKFIGLELSDLSVNEGPHTHLPFSLHAFLFVLVSLKAGGLFRASRHPITCTLFTARSSTCKSELCFYLFAVTSRWRSLVLPNPLTQLHSREFEDVLNRAWSLLADPGKWLSYDEQMIKSTARAVSYTHLTLPTILLV